MNHKARTAVMVVWTVIAIILAIAATSLFISFISAFA